MKELQRKAEKYAYEELGGDCLTTTVDRSPPFGEHCYIHCACDIRDAYMVGWQNCSASLLELFDGEMKEWLESEIKKKIG